MINQQIARELNVNVAQVNAAVSLLDEGATVPFIARYRKEATAGLDDSQLRDLETRLYYLRELGERKLTVLKSIEEQQKLTPELKKAIEDCDNKATLEDIYLPYKPKRRTKAQIAIEAGLEPLANALLADPTQVPQQLAIAYINLEKEVPDADKALEGAQHILMERFSEDAGLIGYLREYAWSHCIMKSVVATGKEVEGAKFSDYFDYEENINKIPSHRALALFRGRREDFLRLSLTLDDDQQLHCQTKVAKTFSIENLKRPADAWLDKVVSFTWKIKLFTKIELDLMQRLREAAEEGAINVFASNLNNLLMAAPAGACVTMGLDPGFRTGVKVVVVDATGKLLTHCAIFPHAPQNEWNDSLHKLTVLCQKLGVKLISIGNGTASRETDKLAAELMAKNPELKMTKVVVSEAGASVYSASEFAAEEFPDLDVSYRGAVSIARRLQDPLAELVKIDPKAIGVGQYQHDVNQSKLGRRLVAVMEDCVNAVGVNVNTASVPLLSSVSGLNKTIAQNIVSFRHEHGAIKRRDELKKVPRLGEKTYEQAIGFLRILEGDNPLDASAVHPESYPVVEKILTKLGRELKEVMGQSDVIKRLSPIDFTDEHFGIYTVTDIISELEKPGRDPRPEFATAEFKEGIEKITDLNEGMILEGRISNVADFGAFVDIGVHQDGLVHKSKLGQSYVSNPHDAVKVGDIVKVKVMAIDLERSRISLSMRLNDTPGDDVVSSRGRGDKSSVAPKKFGQKPIEDPTKGFNQKFKGTGLADALKGAFQQKQ